MCGAGQACKVKNEKSGFGFGSFVVVWMCSGMKVIGPRQLLVV
jgi:hypothetical protein